jgi:membrane protein YqaA with SNARE-associated domain
MRYSRSVDAFFALVGFAFAGPIVSPFFPPLATEAMAIVFGGRGMHPAVVGLACTIGQNLMYVLLYFSGGKLVERWPRLHRQIDLIRVKHSGARRTFTLVTISAAFFGLPPVLPIAIIAKGFGMRIQTLLLIGIPLRFLRFVCLALIGGEIWPTVVRLWDQVWPRIVDGWTGLFA